MVADDEVKINKLKFTLMEDYFNKNYPHWRFFYVDNPADAIKCIRDINYFLWRIKELYPEIKPEDKIFLDLILLDIEFPDQNGGFSVADIIQNEQINLPFIFFSRHEDPETIIAALNRRGYGNKDYCTKSSIFDYKNYKELEIKIVNILKSSGRFRNKYGILVTHGTDTMAWGFSILCYALKGINTNIVITGSQLPLEGFYSPSDAIGNLRTSLYVLTHLDPPGIFVVFNNGKTVFCSHLQKVRKWDFDAFTGKIIGRIIWEEMKTYKEHEETGIPVSIHPEPLLERLYLLRTGGTIEAEKDPVTGALKATGDFVSAYLNTTLAKNFVRDDILNCYPSLKKDSSYLTTEHWHTVCKWIKEIEEREGNSECYIDWKFDWDVKCFLTNPFFTTSDYKIVFDKTRKGLVLLGYGAGNANVDTEENHNFNILPVLKEAIAQGKFIVISSQVPLETYDFDYEAGRKLLEFGAIPSGSLSYPEAQVKLAYILGHQDEIKEVAREYNLSEYQLIKAAFLAGVGFRKEDSKKEYEKITKTKEGGPPIKVIPYDPFADSNKKFNDAIKEVAKYQSG